MKDPKLSAVVIAKNAAATIGVTLESLKFADEVIVVVDQDSRDATFDMARQSGARVFLQPWLGYGRQKNFGAQQTKGDWLLFVDDDEEVSLALAKKIKDELSAPTADIYWLRVVTVFLNRPLYHLYGHNPRLYKKGSAYWSNEAVHEQLLKVANGQRVKLGGGPAGLITTPLLHHSHRNIASYLTKMHHYTTLDAQQMRERGQHRSGRTVSPTILLPVQLTGRQLLKLLLYRRGILDGWAGLVWCLLSAYYEWEMAIKFLALAKKS